MKFISALMLLASTVEVFAQQNSVNKMELVRGEPVGETLPGYPVVVQTVTQCNRLCLQSSGCVYSLFRRNLSPPYERNCWLKPDSIVRPIGQGMFCSSGFSCRSSKKTLLKSPPPPPLGPPSSPSGFFSLSGV